jgi:hypothetical protein
MKRTVIMLAIAAVACTGTPYRVPTPDYEPTKYVQVGYADGGAGGVLIAGLIPVNYTNTTERAVQQAIAKNGGDAIAELTVTEHWYYAYVMIGRSVRVHGLVLRKLKPGETESDYERGRREERERIERERGATHNR